MFKRPPESTGRIRKAQEGEIYGRITEMLGGDRLRVDCADGNERLIRIPGKLKKKVWVRVGDIVTIIPWEVQSDQKGDLKWRYTRAQVDFLRRDGCLDKIL